MTESESLLEMIGVSGRWRAGAADDDDWMELLLMDGVWSYSDPMMFICVKTLHRSW